MIYALIVILILVWAFGRLNTCQVCDAKIPRYAYRYRAMKLPPDPVSIYLCSENCYTLLVSAVEFGFGEVYVDMEVFNW